MARSDQLVQLIKAGSKGDVPAFRRAAEAIIADERDKKHNILADRLETALRAGYKNPLHGGFTPRRDQANDLVFESEPKVGLGDLVLSHGTQKIITELVEEQHRADLLRTHGIEPRHRILLTGPPGNGKTSLAEATAFELMVPLLTVRYDTLIGSFLGETAGRLQRVFDSAATQRCVLFFDEFDTIGKERGDQKEMGEIKRVVSSLLMQMDRLPSHVVVMTASNHPELLDRAVWRRFQLRVSLPMPTAEQVAGFIERYFRDKKIQLGSTPAKIATDLGAHSFAEVSEFCSDILRRAILDRATENAAGIVRLKLQQWKDRGKVSGKN